MLKATLDLNHVNYLGYDIHTVENKWRNYPVINLWLKVRKFDLSLPIFASADTLKNTVTFFQSYDVQPKNVLVVHPNPTILNQLSSSLLNEGHKVISFNHVNRANQEIDSMEFDSIVVPENLKVGVGITYKAYLNKYYPGLRVLTVDKNNYRQTLKEI